MPTVDLLTGLETVTEAKAGTAAASSAKEAQEVNNFINVMTFRFPRAHVGLLDVVHGMQRAQL